LHVVTFCDKDFIISLTFLKAVLEYPQVGRRRSGVDQRGGEVGKDPDARGLYGDAAVYIGTWEVKCPACGEREI